MQIARIEYDGRELYGSIEDGTFRVIKTTRNSDGIESFLFEPIELTEENFKLADIEFRWLPPIARPGKILCVGRNYAEHSREQGKEPESTPLIFSKFITSMTSHQSKITYPSHTSNLDYEVELAVIIGKRASKLTDDDDAGNYIFGYTIANDLTARDVQKSEKQWTRGKGFDASLPIGPHILHTPDNRIPLDNEIWLTVNGEKRQMSKLDHMIFPIPYLVRYISQVITLEPGDILLTGTPEGVGYYMEPKAVLQRGDHVACGVVGIGELRFSIE